MRLWHDNSGQGTSASWFLKYIIVRDLQTMEKSYFICQQWFAVEKDDGRVSLFYFIEEFLFCKMKFRLNVFYQLRVTYKNKNSHMFYQNKLIIVLQKGIFGFQYFLDHHQINLHVFNDVLVVFSYFLLQCFWIFFIMIKQAKHNRIKLLQVYHLVLFI